MCLYFFVRCTFPSHVLFGTMPSFPVNEKAPQWSHTQSGLVGSFSIPWNWSDQWKRETKFRVSIPYDRVSIGWVGRDTGKLMSTRNYENKSYNSSSSNTIWLGICWEGIHVALSRCNQNKTLEFVLWFILSCLACWLSCLPPYHSKCCFNLVDASIPSLWLW